LLGKIIFKGVRRAFSITAQNKKYFIYMIFTSYLCDFNFPDAINYTLISSSKMSNQFYSRVEEYFYDAFFEMVKIRDFLKK